MPSTAWHAEFQDVNNDGFIDLFITKGNVEAMPDFATKDPSNLLLGQADGTFSESGEAAGIVSFARGRGAAVVDLNLDGMLDLVEVNRRENVSLYRNVGWGDAARPAPMGDWIAVRLEQPGPNRDAIGSWIEVRIGRPDDPARADHRRGPRQRRARLDPLRARRCRRSRDPRSMAGRRDGAVARADRQPVRDDRTRSDGTADLGPATGLTGRRRDDQREARRDLPARLRHVRSDARDPGRDLP